MASWSGFWAAHKNGTWPFPPTPGIDFEKEIVLVCILGWVEHCCQSFVNITAVVRTADGYSVTVDMYRHYPEPDELVL